MSPLRALLLAVAVALLLAGLAMLFIEPRSQGIGLLVFGAVLLLGILFERWRYRPPAPPADARWEHTGERFEDPQTGKIIEVLYDPRSGQRRYAGADEERDGHKPG